MRAREAVMRYMRPPLREHELTEQQWRVLRALAQNGPLEPTGLAHLTFLLAPSLSRILRDLEARRLIERRAAKTDLRRSVITITAAGSRLLKVVAPHSKTSSALIAHRFGKARVVALRTLLEDLEASLVEGVPAPQHQTPRGPTGPRIDPSHR
jgi:homoprotocatechuate degradation regulator HpaR